MLIELCACKARHFNERDGKGERAQALKRIPYGHSVSYAELAADIGRPKAVRAVGAAVGRNPISIVLPCHRVLGKNGTLTGFAGGLAHKATLLSLERGTNENTL